MTNRSLISDMDQHVKRMLKLIEEDADSFAKKAEMYYQKRPELIRIVEDFYRMYRSLAERYDHVTGELRKNIQSDLQSQGSGISDIGSEPQSTVTSPDRRSRSRKTGPRAAGFDFFLGGGGGGPGSEFYINKEGDEFSTLDSESESDDSSINNYSGINDEEQGLRRRIIELEVELREVKEKLQLQVREEEISEGHFKQFSDEGSDEFAGKIAEYEEQLQAAEEKIRLSGLEISRLTNELDKYDLLSEGVVIQNGHETGDLDSVHTIQTLEEELRITQEKLNESEEEVASLRQEVTSKGSSIQDLQDQLKSPQNELSLWKNKLDIEAGEVSKLQDRVTRYKTNLSERDHEIRALREAISNANKSLSEENEQLQAEITRISKERVYLEDNLKELDLRCQTLEEDVRRVKAGKEEMEDKFGSQIDQLNADLAEKNGRIEELNKDLEELLLKHNMLISERDDLNTDIAALSSEMSSRDDHIDQLSKHLHQLHMEHVNLIAGAEGARKSAEELCSRIKELEKEVQRKEEIILEGAEEKRAAIRQLCFSLEHYRNGYHRLRQAVIGHKGLPVTAS